MYQLLTCFTFSVFRGPLSLFDGTSVIVSS